METSASLPSASKFRISDRGARWLAWSGVAFSLILALIGLVLQALAGTTSYGLGLPYGVATLAFAAIWEISGALIVAKHPRHPVGWLLVAMIAFTGPENFAFGLLAYAQHTGASAFPGFDLAFIGLAWGAAPFFFLGLTLLLLLYPSGRLLSRKWAIVGWLDLAAVVGYMALAPYGPNIINTGIGSDNPLALAPSRWSALQPVYLFSVGLAVACLMAAAISLVQRFRSSSGVERQQLKWFIYPAMLVILSLTANASVIVLGQSTAVLPIAGLMSILTLAISLVLAIRRHRLYDIDLIINRSLVYGTLTVALAAVYFASAAVIQGAVQLTVRQKSPIAAVASTLIVLALFQPLRSRIQRFIDSRFYRTRYDLARTLDQFGSTLAKTMEIEAQVHLILSTVEEAIKPAHVSLWMRRESRYIDREGAEAVRKMPA